MTSAPFEDPKEGWQVLHFVVPFAAQDVSLADDWRTLGMRATGSQTIVLDNVFVADDAVALRRPRGRHHPAWNVILAVAMPLIMSVYTGVAKAAATIGQELAAKRQGDPTVPYLLAELSNQLTTDQLAADDMVRLASDLDFAMDLERANAILIRKTIGAEHALAAVEKALEAAGGTGFYRKTGLERFFAGCPRGPIPSVVGEEATSIHRQPSSRSRSDRRLGPGQNSAASRDTGRCP